MHSLENRITTLEGQTHAEKNKKAVLYVWHEDGITAEEALKKRLEETRSSEEDYHFIRFIGWLSDPEVDALQA